MDKLHFISELNSADFYATSIQNNPPQVRESSSNLMKNLTAVNNTTLFTPQQQQIVQTFLPHSNHKIKPQKVAMYWHKHKQTLRKNKITFKALAIYAECNVFSAYNASSYFKVAKKQQFLKTVLPHSNDEIAPKTVAMFWRNHYKMLENRKITLSELASYTRCDLSSVYKEKRYLKAARKPQILKDILPHSNDELTDRTVTDISPIHQKELEAERGTQVIFAQYVERLPDSLDMASSFMVEQTTPNTFQDFESAVNLFNTDKLSLESLQIRNEKLEKELEKLMSVTDER